MNGNEVLELASAVAGEGPLKPIRRSMVYVFRTNREGDSFHVFDPRFINSNIGHTCGILLFFILLLRL